MAVVQMSLNAIRVTVKPNCFSQLMYKPLVGSATSGQVAQQREPTQFLGTEYTRPSTGSRCLHSRQGKAPFGAYEPWSEDMACILQGSCMPGSTRYCRTNSMFGKPSLYDINQSSLSTQRSSFHTLRPFLPNTASSDVSRHFSLDGAKNSGRQTAHQLWSEDIACILQGTCLPGSTKYCRTNSMFGKLAMADVAQGSSGRSYSSSAAPDGQVSLTQRQRLKLAVRDYGSTVIIFHVCISLMSLGGFYLAVSSGLDVQSLLKMLHFGEDIISSKLAAGASTFVVAYGVHKVFAPVRIAITLTCTPFIVRYFRSVGFLKVKKPAKS
ncbi:hypothetical protein BSL78_29624 [Apostichopus japonicus]|uniref:DUF1279 domain-containing protein n=1 Tax=Stichopus japonicus TaxID=307972 RepID=A0A2G8JCU3_STIJA|nr:hypothetical protein BSL78_29624 [Apostichopus japonicus]